MSNRTFSIIGLAACLTVWGVLSVCLATKCDAGPVGVPTPASINEVPVPALPVTPDRAGAEDLKRRYAPDWLAQQAKLAEAKRLAESLKQSADRLIHYLAMRNLREGVKVKPAPSVVPEASKPAPARIETVGQVAHDAPARRFGRRLPGRWRLRGCCP